MFVQVATRSTGSRRGWCFEDRACTSEWAAVQVAWSSCTAGAAVMRDVEVGTVYAAARAFAKHAGVGVHGLPGTKPKQAIRSLAQSTGTLESIDDG